VTDAWDPDIAALNLSDGEKEGLQLYRNYKNAFENHAIKLFVDEANARSIDLSPLDAILSHLCREDIRFLPVLACAFANLALYGSVKPALLTAISSRCRDASNSLLSEA
jgi:hypothetical protein